MRGRWTRSGGTPSRSTGTTSEIDRAYAEAAAPVGRPTVILARTRKGRGVAAVEDAEGAHGKPVPDPDEAIREPGGLRQPGWRSSRPGPGPHPPVPQFVIMGLLALQAQ
jgi:hypothetical protein